jgi:hypothetical protein
VGVETAEGPKKTAEARAKEGASRRTSGEEGEEGEVGEEDMMGDRTQKSNPTASKLSSRFQV